MRKQFLLFLAIVFTSLTFGQAKGVNIGYIDMEYILQNVPSYTEAKNQLELKAQKWKQEIEVRNNEITKLKDALKAEQVLLTKELIAEKQEEISFQEKELLDYNQKRFGPNGDLLLQKAVLVKPIQDQIFTIVQDLADSKKYDFIFDKSSDLTMLFASKRYDISDQVLRTLTRAEQREQLTKKQLKLQQEKDAKEDFIKENLRIYNRLLKIKSTYVERFLEREENGRYYFYYKQHGTVSGRYGSDAQQLPRPKEEGDDDPIVVEYTNRVRAFFIHDEGNIFIDNDYESLEPHVFAHVSGDDGLKDIFRNNWDFYSTIAIKTEGLNQYSGDKKADNFLRKLAPKKRNTAKAYALGIPYGMGAYALGKNIGVSTKEADKLVKGYLNGFPELDKWMKRSEMEAKTEGYVKTQVGRVRHLPKVKAIYETIGDNLLDWNYKRKLEYEFGKDQVKSLSRDFVNGLNNAKNVQIQGLSASIVNRAAMEINREFKKRGIAGWVCAQIHDQIVCEVPKENADEAAKIVQDKMENTTKLSIALKAPPMIALNLRDGH